jgi:hypothetical protein
MKRFKLDKKQSVETSTQTEENELSGCLGLGMKKEALVLARKQLRRERLSEKVFMECLTVVESYAPRPKRWRKLLELAYQNLKSSELKTARFQMLIFFDAKIKDDVATLRFGPEKLTRRSNMVEILLVWNCWLRLGNMKKLAAAVPAMSNAIQTAAYPSMRSLLATAYAQYWALRAKIEGRNELGVLTKSFKGKMTVDAAGGYSKLNLDGIQFKIFRS